MGGMGSGRKKQIKTEEIFLVYLEEKSLGKAGKKINLTRQRISQILLEDGISPNFFRIQRIKIRDEKLKKIFSLHPVRKIGDFVRQCREQHIIISKNVGARILRECKVTLYRGRPKKFI